MGTLVNRRRVMGGVAADEIIMTSESNPSVMAICYAQGWAANADYMTKKEAEAVTSVGTVFRSSSIGDFHEFQYFTSVTSLSNTAFASSSIAEITFPNSLRTIGGTGIYTYVFQACHNLTQLILNEGVVRVGDRWVWDSYNISLIDFPSTVTALNGYAIQPYNLNQVDFNIICRATTPPTLGSSSYLKKLVKVYVPDNSVDLYKATSKWADFAEKITPLSEYIPS